MSCETLYVTGIVRKDADILATVYTNVPISALLVTTEAVSGQVLAGVLAAVVRETVFVTGKCRQA